MSTVEQWLPVPGYEGFYEVSDQGSVRSLTRMERDKRGYPRPYRGLILKGSRLRDGRRTVLLCRATGSQRRTVSSLVLTTFVGPRPPGMYACHSDGDQLNDSLHNLRWDTPTENSYDRVRHGNHVHANKTHCPRGHVLDHPNLVLDALRRAERGENPGRTCRACDLARHAVRRAHLRGESMDFRTAADRYYARIMKETPCLPPPALSRS